MTESNSPDSNVAVLGVQTITLDVPDLSVAPHFFDALGVQTRSGAGHTEGVVQAGANPFLVLHEGPKRRLKRLGFNCPAAAFAGLLARATAAGVTIKERQMDRMVLVGPDGIEAEIQSCGLTRGPGGVHDIILPRAPTKAQAGLPKAKRFSHVAIFVTDMDAALAFYCDVLGLKISDQAAGILAFLHSPLGSEHHVLALAKGSAPGLHHYSLEMGTIDAIGLRSAHMKAQGFTRGWGIGRHVLGSNFFHYFRDPWESMVELTTGLDYIAPGESWQAAEHGAEDALYLWGPEPPADFLNNTEVQGQPVAA